MTSSRIPYIASVVPENWNSVLRFSRDVQKYLSTLAKSDQTYYISELYISGSTASRLLATDASKKVVSADLNSWVSGTANQVNVADDGDGTITLSTPQDIDTACDFQANTIQLDASSWQIVSKLNLDDTNYNTFLGLETGNNDNGQANIFVGYRAGYNNDTSGVGTEGDYNIYVGYQAGYGNTPATLNTGTNNVAFGRTSLFYNTSGYSNLAIGTQTLYSNTTGYGNTALGVNAGYSNTTGPRNFYLGTSAGYYNQTGSYNICIGSDAGYGVSGQSYSQNCFFGFRAGYGCTTGSSNIGVGHLTLKTMTNAIGNVAIGVQAGEDITNSYNVLIGHQSGANLTNSYRNVLIGSFTAVNATTATQNTLVGGYAGTALTSGSSNVLIGHRAGFRQTSNSNLLIIDNQDRSSVANEVVNSLLYGVFDSASANQSLRINGYAIAKEALKILERSSDPTQPSEGECVIWLSDGTGYGDDGDICAASTAGGVTKKAIIFDHSAGDAW